MGLHESTHGTGGRRVYLSINEMGNIVQKNKEAADGYTERKTSKGAVVFEKSYESMEGRLTSVEIKSTDFNGVHLEKGQWVFTLTDDEGLTMYLSLPYSSGYAKNILNSLCSATSFDAPISLKPYKFIPKGETKTKQGVVVKQSGERLNWAFNIEDLPALEKVKVKGVQQTDDSAQLEFYEEKVAEIVVPLLKGTKHDAEIETEVPF